MAVCLPVYSQVAGHQPPYLTKDAFLAKWRYLALKDPRAACEALLYAGFDLADFTPGAGD